jgi:hypothetical protein
MPAALRLNAADGQVVEAYLAAMRAVGRKTGHSTTQAARTCQARLTRAGGWARLTAAERIKVVGKARSFASWLMVTGQLTVDAELISALNLQLGHAARSYCPEDHEWFRQACLPLGVDRTRIGTQWNVLAKVTAMTATSPAQVGDAEFWPARAALLEAYQHRGMPEAGRNLAGVFNQLQLTLFHAGRLTTWKRPRSRQPVSVTGWAQVTPGFADTARRYLRPGHHQPAAEHGHPHRARSAPVRHLASYELSRRRQLCWPAARAHRGVQNLVEHHTDAAHRQAAQPGQYQEHADQPALLLRPNHRMGLSQRPITSAGVSRRPADNRQAPSPLPR